MLNAEVDTTAVSSGMCQLWRLHRLAFKVLQMERGMKDRAQRARFLMGVEVFRRMNLSSGDFNLLADAAEVGEFSNGQTIIREGERDRVLYVLTEGEVDVVLGERHITRFQPGAYFGEMSMLTGEPRTATCTSVGNCCCLIVSAEAWESVLGAYSVVLARGMRRRLLQLLPIIRQITSGLSQSEEKQLLDSFVEREYSAGDLIMREGDAALSVFVLEQGEVAIWKRGASQGKRGRAHEPSDLGSEVARRGAGELLGEGAMRYGALVATTVREASVTALTRCRLSEVGREQLLGTVKNAEVRGSLHNIFSAVAAERKQAAEHSIRLSDAGIPHEIAQEIEIPKAGARRNWNNLGASILLSSQLIRLSNDSAGGSSGDGGAWGDQLNQAPDDLTKMQVLMPLGTGAFGKVELVLGTTSKLFALKTQRIQKLETILREEQAMVECRCPFVMGFFGAEQHGCVSYLLTEFMPGGDLKALMDARKTLPLAEARFYFACVMSAVAEMHGKDWMRRSMGKVLLPPWQCPSPAPAAPQGAPAGSARLRTPRVGPGHWAPRHRLGGSSEAPPKSPSPLALSPPPLAK